MNTIGQIAKTFDAMRLVVRGERLQVTAPAVSAWSAAEHIDHLAKVTTVMLERILAGQPLRDAKPINLLGRVILFVGRIPRGAGRAPAALHGTRATAEELERSIARCEELLRQVGEPMRRSRTLLVQHPRFGGLTAAQALRFIAIHNRHHLRIVADM